jgi:hypothetical protein
VIPDDILIARNRFFLSFWTDENKCAFSNLVALEIEKDIPLGRRINRISSHSKAPSLSQVTKRDPCIDFVANVPINASAPEKSTESSARRAGTFLNEVLTNRTKERSLRNIVLTQFKH